MALSSPGMRAIAAVLQVEIKINNEECADLSLTTSNHGTFPGLSCWKHAIDARKLVPYHYQHIRASRKTQD